MKTIWFQSVLLCFTLLQFECAYTSNDVVYVVEKTKTYHTESCPRVNMADAKIMTREEAQALNCKACPGCKPDSVLQARRKN